MRQVIKLVGGPADGLLVEHGDNPEYVYIMPLPEYPDRRGMTSPHAPSEIVQEKISVAIYTLHSREVKMGAPPRYHFTRYALR